jgi:hypothetical protein
MARRRRGRLRHPSGALHLIGVAVEDHHIAIEIGEGAEAEIAMPQD